MSAGIEFDLAPFWSMTAWSDLYRRGRYLQKALGLMRGMLGRFWFYSGCHAINLFLFIVKPFR